MEINSTREVVTLTYAINPDNDCRWNLVGQKVVGEQTPRSVTHDEVMNPCSDLKCAVRDNLGLELPDSGEAVLTVKLDACTGGQFTEDIVIDGTGMHLPEVLTGEIPGFFADNGIFKIMSVDCEFRSEKPKCERLWFKRNDDESIQLGIGTQGAVTPLAMLCWRKDTRPEHSGKQVLKIRAAKEYSGTWNIDSHLGDSPRGVTYCLRGKSVIDTE